MIREPMSIDSVEHDDARPGIAVLDAAIADEPRDAYPPAFVTAADVGAHGHVSRRYYRVAEVAAHFSVSLRTVYRLIEEGAIPAVRIKGCVRVPAPVLGAYELHLPGGTRRGASHGP